MTSTLGSELERAARVTLRHARRIVILVIGSTLLLIGILLLVLPGPGYPTIIAALALLGLEFAWAKHWLARVKQMTRSVVDGVSARFRAPVRKPPDQRDAG